jgi:hypothetical protein
MATAKLTTTRSGFAAACKSRREFMRFRPPSWPGDNTDLFCVTQEVPKMVTDVPEPAAEQATPRRRRERDSWAASFFPPSLSSWYWSSRTRMLKWLGERAGQTPQALANPTRPCAEDGTPARTVSTDGATFGQLIFDAAARSRLTAKGRKDGMRSQVLYPVMGLMPQRHPRSIRPSGGNS